MMRLFKWAFCLCCLVIVPCGFAASRTIALTIDDLPFVGDSQRFHLGMILEALKQSEVPATGFVIAGKVRPDILPLLQQFREAGLGLGNHTMSHANLNQTPLNDYLEEIDQADKILQAIMTKPKYFRFPYLATGSGQKKETIRNFLTEKKYQVAPITIDSRDFVFNQLLLAVPEKARRNFMIALKPCYLDFIRQQTIKAEQVNPKSNKPQILLIHANLLNAYVLPDIIALYKSAGYKFISLKEALRRKKEPANEPATALAVVAEKPVPKVAVKSAKLDFDKEGFIAWD